MKRPGQLRKSPLRSGLKPLTRTLVSGSARTPARQPHKPMKTRKVSKRFAKRRDPTYCAWIRTLPCCVPRCICASRIECAHVRTRAAGAYDRGETVPLCLVHHRVQHNVGLASFQSMHALDLSAIAARLAADYTAGGGEANP